MDIQVLPYAWATINSQRPEVGSEELMQRDVQAKDSLIVPRNGLRFTALKLSHAAVQDLAKHYSSIR